MKSYKLLLINLIFVLFSLESTGQCTANFEIGVAEYTETQLGQIDIEVENGQQSERYSLKVYQINSEVDLVKERTQFPINNKLRIDGLTASVYWVRIEWGDNCFKTIGGLEGIKVGPNLEKR